MSWTRKGRDVNSGVSEELLGFATAFAAAHGPVHLSEPELTAREFRAWFDLPHPFTIDAASALLLRLAYRDVRLKPYFEHTCDLRGHWQAYAGAMTILVDANRPVASRLRTVLHEIIEPLWVASIAEHHDSICVADREHWCNRFAVMVKMPPEIFGPAAWACGLDVRHLAAEFGETLAAVTRHLRDTEFAREFFYYCRFELKFGQPKEASDRFVRALQKSRGLCVRTVDVVKTAGLHVMTDGRTSRPGYNLAGQDEYRIMHPALKKYIVSERPLLLPKFTCEWGPDYARGELFDSRQFAAVLQSYGYRAKPAFFMLVLPADRAEAFEPLIQSTNARICPEIDWLFRVESCPAVKPKVSIPWSPKMKDTDGQEYDPEMREYSWPGLYGES